MKKMFKFLLESHIAAEGGFVQLPKRASCSIPYFSPATLLNWRSNSRISSVVFIGQFSFHRLLSAKLQNFIENNNALRAIVFISSMSKSDVGYFPACYSIIIFFLFFYATENTIGNIYTRCIPVKDLYKDNTESCKWLIQ